MGCHIHNWVRIEHVKDRDKAFQSLPISRIEGGSPSKQTQEQDSPETEAGRLWLRYVHGHEATIIRLET